MTEPPREPRPPGEQPPPEEEPRPREPAAPPSAEPAGPAEGQAAPPVDRPGGRSLGALALGLLLAAAGLVWLLASVDALDVSAQVWLAGLLVLVGLALAVLPEGARGVLVVVGVALALGGAAASAVDVELEGGIGESRERPSDVADLEDYEHAIGSLKLDLTDLQLGAGATVRARLGIGELLVTVPEDVEVVVDAHVGMGDIQALGEQESGLDVDLERRFEDGGGELVLELEVGIGAVKVAHDATF